jgi:sugar phosphate isomerase/epimerase
MPLLILATQLPPPTPVGLGPGAQIALKLIDQLPSILTAVGVILTALVGLYNAAKIRQVKAQGDGHFSELTKALANSVPASAVPIAPTIVVAPPAVTNGPSVAGGRRADDASPAAAVESLNRIDANTATTAQNTAHLADDEKGGPDGVR